MSGRGRFISLEGGEGVGKSTQLMRLAAELRARGIDVVETREPGGSDGAEKIRELLLGGSEERWGTAAEALLFAAARADHAERLIRPALAAGRWVLADRYIDSSLAYQGGAGGLGIERVRAVNELGMGDCYPDRTLVLLVEAGSDRAKARDSGAADRIGARPDDYHQRVERAFRALAEAEPQRVRLIDASGSHETVTDRLVDAIADLLP